MENELRDTLSILKLYYTYNPENNFKEKKPKKHKPNQQKKRAACFYNATGLKREASTARKIQLPQ